jgi:hypothetical protein
MSDDSLETLPIGVLSMPGRLTNDWSVFAALSMAAEPMITLFLIGQGRPAQTDGRGGKEVVAVGPGRRVEAAAAH